MSKAQHIVKVGPPKSFFVKTLTRDIALKDAILDLLDNCVDGIVRDLSRKGNKPSSKVTPYKGYWAKLTITPDKFIIEDNCGGIPRDTAINYALRFGRDEKDNEDLPTVGIYGIGMKRAIFKMGESCTITSRHKTDSYSVQITPEWLRDSDDWQLDIVDKKNLLNHSGTKIHVSQLYTNISKSFEESRTGFAKDLIDEVAQLFSIIINKGFKVEINKTAVAPKEITLLAPKDLPKKGLHKIEPFLFKGKIKGVEIDLAVGFYRPLAKEEEIESEQDIKRTTENAGWSVICNDRLVLFADKTTLTGWGIAGIPAYHTQFIAIAGIVTFKSSDPWFLPVNTTKRGVDMSSEVYQHTLDIMREGMRTFIDFTNKWKSRLHETEKDFSALSSYTAKDSPRFNSKQGWTTVRRLSGTAETAMKYVPSLPKPEGNSKDQRISYLRPSKDVDLLKKYFYTDIDPDSVRSSEIGEKSFDECLKLAKKKRG